MFEWELSFMLILGVIEIDEPPSSSSGKGHFMETSSDRYNAATLIYTRLVRQESQEAAAAIELIHTAFGSHAALHAAVMITILKMEVLQNHWIPNIGVYAYLLADYPDAFPLTRYAALCCFRTFALGR